jgi:hypothetical protein
VEAKQMYPVSLFSTLLGCLITLSAILCIGCGGKKTVTYTPVDSAAFDSANPEIKQMWDLALEQAGTNGFSPAVLTLRLLARENITPEQYAALRNASLNYEDQLRKQAAAGDEDAKKEMERIGVSPTPPKAK